MIKQKVKKEFHLKILTIPVTELNHHMNKSCTQTIDHQHILTLTITKQIIINHILLILITQLKNKVPYLIRYLTLQVPLTWTFLQINLHHTILQHIPHKNILMSLLLIIITIILIITTESMQMILLVQIFMLFWVKPINTNQDIILQDDILICVFIKKYFQVIFL